MNPERSKPNHRDEFFAGNGEMAALMRSTDWSQTALGPVETWSQSLKTVVRIMLTSRYAMWMGWGDNLNFFYNDAYRPTLGVKHPWALGQPAQQVWAEIWPVIGPRVETVLSSGEATWDEALLLFLERSGYPEETYHTFSYSPLADNDEQTAGMLCVVTEVTERVLGERRLTMLREVAASLASTQTLDEVFAAVQDCLGSDARDMPFTLTYLLDSDDGCARLACATGISDAHPAAVAVLCEDDSASLWPLQQLLRDTNPVLVEDLPAHFGDLPTGPWPKSPDQALLVALAQQGQDRPAGFLVVALNPFCRPDENYLGFVTLLAGQVAAGLANARAYEEERKRAEALAELNRSKTAFFSNVSHEFRTPLTLMLGPMEEALGEEAGGLDRDSLEIVYRNGLRLLKLVNALLDFSRLEAGRMQARFERTDIATFTAELAGVFRSAVEKAGMRLIVNCSPIVVPVYIDRDMWEKVVLNLLSNAFKFTAEGEIEVALQAQGAAVVFTVRDTGTGIPEPQLTHIFDRFHRVEGARARTHEGTGIGLALVLELVKLHGGEIEVSSRVGEGSRFTITLPSGTAHLQAEHVHSTGPDSPHPVTANLYIEEALQWLPNPVTEAPTSESDLGRGHGREISDGDAERTDSDRSVPTILLAEDNADMRAYVQRLLRAEYEVVAVTDGDDLVSAAHSIRPDLIVSDVMLPGRDGFSALQALRAEPETRSIPIILLSARAGREARIEGLAAGADDYVTKPFSANELMARVAALLKLSATRSLSEVALKERTRLAELGVEIGTAIAAKEGLAVVLQRCADILVEHLGAALARIWTFNEATGVLELQSSAGLYTHLDGPHSRVPIGRFKIGLIAEERLPHLTNAVIGDPRVGDQEWAKREGMVAFAGYPLLVDDRLVGVVGLFARHMLSANTLNTLAAVSHQIALGVERKWAEVHVRTLNVRLQRAMTETHHRVKNNLQLMSALIEMQRGDGREMVPVSEFVRLGANIRALGVIHDILTHEAKEGAEQDTLSAKALLERLLGMLQQTAGTHVLRFAIDEVRLAGRQATSLALITNELVANAQKHGRSETLVMLTVSENTARLQVEDDGPGFPPDFNPLTSANTGIELIENMVQWDLLGKTSYDCRPGGGGRVIVSFPIASPER